MTAAECIFKKISEIYSRIEELKARASSDPDKVEAVLTSVIEELEMSSGDSCSYSLKRGLCGNEQVRSVDAPNDSGCFELTGGKDGIHKAIEGRLIQSESRFRTLFKHSPIPTWEMDFSRGKACLDAIATRSAGIISFREYLCGHPEEVADLVSMADVLDINQKSREFFRIGDHDPVPGEFGAYFGEGSWTAFTEWIISLAEGSPRFEGEISIRTGAGDLRTVSLSSSVVPGCEATLSRVLVSFVDITERKRAEELNTAYRDLGLALAATQSLDEALKLCVDTAVKISGMDCGGAYIVDDRGDLALAYSCELSDDFLEKVSYYGAGSENWRVVMAGKPIYIKPGDMPLRQKILRNEGLKSIAAIPMIHKGRTIGCFNTGSHTREDIPDCSRSALEAMIAQVGNAVARLKAEEALRESEELFRSLVDNMLDSAVIIDWNGNVLFANNSAMKLAGIEPPLKPGLNVLDMVSPGQAEKVKGDLRQTRDGHSGGGFMREYKIKVEDGAEKWVECLGTRIAFKGSAADLVTLRDITERKKADEEIYRSRQMLQLVLDTIPQNVFWRDRNLTFIGCNRAFARHKGLDQSAIIGRDEFELGWGEVIGPHLEDDISVMETDTPKLDYEEPLTMPDGRRRWLRTNKVPLHSQSGEVMGILVSFEDITERKQMEVEIRKSRDRLEQRVVQRTADLQRAYAVLEEKEVQNRQLSELSPDAVTVFKDGRLVFVNKAGIRLLGASSAEDVMGRTIAEIVHPDFIGLIDERIRGLLGPADERHADQNPLVEQKLIRLDGRVIDVESASARILYDGSPALLAVARDITARKAAERELRAAKEAAEAAARAKSEFLATMSHEIRTPMNAVLGMASILRGTDLEEEQKECIEIIDSSGRALLCLIDDILDFTKMEKGKMKLKCQPFSLRSCIEEALDMVASSAYDKGLELSFEVKGQVPEALLGDSSRIRQVLINLLSNSVKFTDAGTIEVILSAARDHDDLYEVLFEVRDTGIGISKNSLGKLFEPFSQGDMSNTRKYGGTGLGLAISRSLVGMMGGRIWAQSTPGVGSVFRFTIVAEAYAGMLDDAGPGIDNVGAGAGSDAPERVGDLRILLAEDNPVNQKMALLMLKKMGYRADAAANGLEVIEALKQSSYDVILMDVQMPEMDGIEATKRIREMWPLGPKIIALTAYALDGDREMCLEAGMDGYISKPMNKDDLEVLLGGIANSGSSCFP